MLTLQVSENKRYLTTADGQPYFLIGDTAWELFHRLTRSEAEQYLSTRAAQGYNMIQAVILAEFDGLCTHFTARVQSRSASCLHSCPIIRGTNGSRCPILSSTIRTMPPLPRPQ